MAQFSNKNKSCPLHCPAPSRGFTLVELLVGLTIFVFVSSSTTAILVSMIQSHQKIVQVQYAVDNGRYAMETMAKAIRMSEITSVACVPPCITMNHPTRGALQYALSGGAITEQVGAATPLAMTSSRVAVDNLYFVIDGVGDEGVGLREQPRVTIILRTRAGTNTINLQTTVSQRDLDSQ